MFKMVDKISRHFRQKIAYFFYPESFCLIARSTVLFLNVSNVREKIKLRFIVQYIVLLSGLNVHGSWNNEERSVEGGAEEFKT